MSVPCDCSSLPNFLRGDTSNAPCPGLHLVREREGGWLQLFHCPACGQYWQLDVWDKFQVGLAIKITEPSAWETFDDKPMRVAYLIQSRGGLSTERCGWHGCGAACLRGLVFCPTHAYDRMGLRE
jgi:hypothetical protein